MLAILIFLLGLGILFYPVASDLWNQHRQNRLITNYTQSTAALTPEDHSALWEAAREYNKTLDPGFRAAFTGRQLPANDPYWGLLNPDGSGIMGYIEIPVIDVMLPIYHGTKESVLQIAVGHLDWTSLPVGGAGSHCVLSGHRGLPSARLFTDLDKLKVGDVFMLHVLNEILTYEIDQILIVEPQDTDPLLIEPGKDLCTLITCTPYGINSHRMLVRGHRIESQEEPKDIRITADAVRIEPLMVAPIVAVPILLVLLIILLLPKQKKGKL